MSGIHGMTLWLCVCVYDSCTNFLIYVKKNT